MKPAQRSSLRHKLAQIRDDATSGAVDHEGFVLVPLHLYPSPQWRRQPLEVRIAAFDIDGTLHAVGAAYFGPPNQYQLTSARDGFTGAERISSPFDLFYFESDDDDDDDVPYMPLDFGCFQGKPGREITLSIAASPRMMESDEDPASFVLVLVCRRVSAARAAQLERRARTN